MSGSPTKNVDTTTNNQPSQESTNPNEYLNTLYKQAIDENGEIKWENLGNKAKDPVVQAAIIAEKRRRDTQAAYTKANQKALQLEKQVEILSSQVKPKVEDFLTAEQKEELEALKYEQPDVWYAKMKQLEEELDKKLKEKLSVDSKEVTLQAVLDSYNLTNPDKPLDKATLELEVPPRLFKELEEGKIDYEAFIEKASKFIYGEKQVKDQTPPNVPNLNKSAGMAGTEGIVSPSDDYENTIF